jgi:hypothetical protein
MHARIIMKTCTVLSLAAVLLLPSFESGAAEPSKWQSDWAQFGKELTTMMEKPGAVAGEVDRAFNGKTVEWTGEVAAITAPDAKRKYGQIEMKMPPVNFAKGGGTKVSLSEIRIAPKDDIEWKSWANIKPGARVTFRTTLKSPGFGGMACVSVLHGMGPNAGKTEVVIFTEGAAKTDLMPSEAGKKK